MISVLPVSPGSKSPIHYAGCGTMICGLLSVDKLHSADLSMMNVWLNA